MTPLTNFFEEYGGFFLKEPKDSPKKLTMAKLLVLEMVLFPRRNDKYRLVREEILSLACDLERFESHCWGRRVYEETIDSLMKVARANRKERSSNKPGFNILGYPFGFQVFSFPFISTYRLETLLTQL